MRNPDNSFNQGESSGVSDCKNQPNTPTRSDEKQRNPVEIHSLGESSSATEPRNNLDLGKTGGIESINEPIIEGIGALPATVLEEEANPPMQEFNITPNDTTRGFPLFPISVKFGKGLFFVKNRYLTSTRIESGIVITDSWSVRPTISFMVDIGAPAHKYSVPLPNSIGSSWVTSLNVGPLNAFSIERGKGLNPGASIVEKGIAVLIPFKKLKKEEGYFSYFHVEAPTDCILNTVYRVLKSSANSVVRRTNILRGHDIPFLPAERLASSLKSIVLKNNTLRVGFFRLYEPSLDKKRSFLTASLEPITALNNHPLGASAKAMAALPGTPDPENVSLAHSLNSSSLWKELAANKSDCSSSLEQKLENIDPSPEYRISSYQVSLIIK